MKKLLIGILAMVLLLLPLTMVGCEKDSSVVRLNEVTHSVFYAPLYVAINNGYFADEGLTIELTNGGGADKSMTAVMSNQADIGLMGPEACVYVNLQGSTNYPIIFGQLTKKDGSFLIGRNANPDFKWSDLDGAEIIGGRKGGMPAMCLEYALTKTGMLDKIDLNYDVQFDLITAAFESGQGDYCTMFEPGASQYVAQGKGHIVASVGATAGEMPYTCFMATKSYIDGNKGNVEKFMKAIVKGIKFVTENDENKVAEALAASFPTTDKALLASSVKSYKAIDAYMTDPVMTEAAFDNMINLLISCKMITERPVYTTLVDNSIVKSIK